MKRILLIALPAVVIVAVFATALAYYSRPDPTASYADSFYRRPPTATVAPVTPSPTNTITPQAQSGLTGTVTLVSKCLKLRSDKPATCTGKPYSTTVSVMTEDTTRQVTSFISAKDGTYKVVLAPGTYVLGQAAIGATMGYPTIESQTVTVKANTFTTVDIKFDSSTTW